MSDPNRPTTRCAKCHGVVYADAASCKHCGAARADFLSKDGPPPPEPPRCPACHGRVHASHRRCKHCGADLP